MTINTLTQAAFRIPATAPEWFRQALEKPVQSGFFSHADRNLHFLHWPRSDGQAPAASLPALVFIHGFRGHARWWGFIAPLFTEKYRVYALDLSGMGDSDAPQSYDTDTHSNDILAFIDHLAVAEVTVVAHSFGGARTFRAASKAPQRFKKIVAIDSYVGFGGGFAGTDPAPQKGSKVYSTQEEGMERFRLIPPQPVVIDYACEYIAYHSLKRVESGWTWKFDPDLLVDHILRNDGDTILPQVQCPVDYIYGSESSVITAARAEQIQTLLANPGQFIKIAEGHHHIMLSHPLQLMAALQQLL